MSLALSSAMIHKILHYPAGDITVNPFNVRIFHSIVTGLLPRWACEFAYTSKDLRERLQERDMNEQVTANNCTI